MFSALATFELRRRVKMISTWVYAAVLAGAGLLLMLAAGGVFRGVAANSGSERVLVNSPHALYGTINGIALFGLFMVAAVFGQAAHQDFGHNTWMLVFTKNVKKAPYLLGRFLGAYVFSAVLLLTLVPGLLIGTVGVWMVDKTQLAPHQTFAYVWPYLVGVWPTLFFAGSVFFSLAALTRRMAPVYVGVVVLVLGYVVLSSLMSDLSNRSLGSLLDPFGFITFENVARYWTPAERNRDLIPFTGALLANRLLWCTVGALLLGLTVVRFRTDVEEHAGSRPAPKEEQTAAALALPVVTATPSFGSWARTAANSAWLAFRDVYRSPVYWSFVVAGLGTVILYMSIIKDMYGTATLPLTWQVLERATDAFRPFVLILITFYAGELVWKERDAGLGDIVDATRAPTWVGYSAKLGSLLLVALSLRVTVALAALVTQVTRGFFEIEGSQYFTSILLVDFSHDILMCVLAFVAQVIIHHKYLAYLVMVLHFAMQAALNLVGVEDRLVRYASGPSVPYSDMNGYGPFLGAVAWYRLYWSSMAVLLLAVGAMLVVRGRGTAWKERLLQSRARRTTGWKWSVAVAALMFVGTGAFLTYHTRILNPYETQKDSERMQARYEKEYKSFAALPHPRVTDVDVTLHVHPKERRVEALGTYRVRNKTEQPISKVLLSLSRDARVRKLTLAGAEQPSKHDEPLGLYVYELTTPLSPGAEADLVFDLEFAPPVLVHGSVRPDIAENGTFFHSTHLPTLGYQAELELEEDGDRKEYGLAPKERMADRDDPNAKANNYITADADFVSFRATVSTSPDQIAVAPGYLEKEWTEGDRRFFRYAMDQPILKFYSVLSARYAVARDSWNGVALEIFHHPTHVYNLDRMMRGMKDALAYCSENFGPYQHRQARILEFPRYGSFAQAFPNTIPYSEAVGFVAQVRDGHPDDLDYPYYVTAHEIAHQWWAHQVVGANAQGATMTSETLAQYSALMVMKKLYGPTKMKRFLRYELDKYLMGRAFERKKEMPLSRVENQPYIHYQKGSLAMYALQDFIGEERVNRALKRYVEKVRFKGPPYTGSTELMGFLREETPPEYQYLFEDLFDTITLYDNRVLSATTRPNSKDGWDVTLKLLAKKYRSDESGRQTELTFSDWMDVGALDAQGNALFLEKRKVNSGESEITFSVPSKPAMVGVDPLNMLVDRTPQDNVMEPSLASVLALGKSSQP